MISKAKKVCFLSTVHPYPFETRMFHKEAKTLSAAGYEVVYIGQHNRAEIAEGIRINPLPRPKTRLDRMTRLMWNLIRLAIKERADVYHLHDPELIPAGLVLKLLGRKVVYDVHEAFGEKIPSKEWIPIRLRPLLSRVFPIFEKLSSRWFDHIITADRFVARQFKSKKVVVIANYPVLEMLKKVSLPHKAMSRNGGTTIAIYAGGLTKERGFFRMLDAMNSLSSIDIDLHLLGSCENPSYERVVERTERVKYFGVLGFEKVFDYLTSSNIGLALFQPVPAYLYAGENTNKLFEYMACGLAVIASNFPNLREFVEGNKCGFCVDPTSPKEISSAIRFLHENPKIRMEMGENGRKAVMDKYNWEQESKKLLKIYEELCEK